MITIIDYDAGNLRSVENALQFLGEEAKITRDPQEILKADKVILPGVGAELSNQVGSQLIRIVAQLLYLVTVLVVAGMGALNVGDFLPELIFKVGIVLVGP